MGRRLAGVIICAILIGGCLLAWLRAAEGGIAVDYLAFATGGRLVATDSHHLYNLAAQADAQAGLLGYRPPAGDSFPQVYVNPPFAAELIRPWASLPLQLGTDLFCLALIAALGVAAWLVYRRLPAASGTTDRWAFASLAGFSTAGAYGVLLGQWSPLLAVVGLVSLVLLDRGHVVAAGIVLALLLLKPQIVWLLAPGLLITARWHLLSGFVAGGVVLGLLSLGVVGVDGARGYVDLLTVYATAPAAITGRSIADLAGLYTNDASIIPAITLISGVVALLGVAVWRRHLTADATAVAVLILLSLITSGHTNPQDFALLAMAAAVFVAAAPGRVMGLSVALNAAVVIAVINWKIPLDLAVLLAAVGCLIAATRPTDGATASGGEAAAMA